MSNKTLLRKKALAKKRIASKVWRDSFKELKSRYPVEWETIHTTTHGDREATRRELRRLYPADFASIYTRHAKQNGITPHTTEINQEGGSPIQSSNLIIKQTVKQSSPSDFTKEGYSLIARELMPSPSGGVFSSMSRVLFADNIDGTEFEAVGCNKCFMLFRNLQATAHHVGRVHNGKTGIHKAKTKKAKAKPIAKPSTKPVVVTTTPLIPTGIDPVKAITDLVAQRQYWEAQAKAYEEQLNAIRNAFNGK
jgi:uncharacterized C2H2 Zn-finger protein